MHILIELVTNGSISEFGLNLHLTAKFVVFPHLLFFISAYTTYAGVYGSWYMIIHFRSCQELLVL